jgi:hypothetical protein
VETAAALFSGCYLVAGGKVKAPRLPDWIGTLRRTQTPMAISTDQVLTFLGGGLVVFLLEQLIAHFHRRRSVLGYIIDTRTLAERSDPDLKISYKGHDVDRVDSHRVTLKNVGNTALNNVPVFVVPASGRLLFYEIKASPGIHCPVLTEEPPLAFTFNLLNPGESIDIQVVVLNSPNPSMSIGARANHLRVRDLSNVTSVSTLLGVIADSSSGLTWSLTKVLQVILRNRA